MDLSFQSAFLKPCFTFTSHFSPTIVSTKKGIERIMADTLAHATSTLPGTTSEVPMAPSAMSTAASSSNRFSAWRGFIANADSLQLRAVIALLAVYLIWGTTMGAMRFGIETIPPALFGCARYLLAGSILLLIAILRKDAWPSKADLRRHAISGIFLFSAGNAIAAWAVQYIPTVLGAALMASTPFWMIGLSAILPVSANSVRPKDPLTLPVIVGILIGFSGILTVLAPQLFAEFQAGSSSNIHFGLMGWLSVIGMIATSMFWAYGSLYAKQRPTKNSIFMEVGFQNLSAGLFLSPLLLPYLSGFTPIPHVSLASFLALMYLVIFGTIIAVPCYFFMLHHLPISIASTFAYVAPIITMLFGYWVLNETLSPTMFIGAAIILAGVVWVQIAQMRALNAQKKATAKASLQNALQSDIRQTV